MFLLPAVSLSTVTDSIREAEDAIRADLGGLKKADFCVDAFYMLLKARKTDEGKVALCREMVQQHAPGTHASWKKTRRTQRVKETGHVLHLR